MLWTYVKMSEQQEQTQKQLRRRCKMPVGTAQKSWQAAAEDRPEGTPTEKDPQRRQDPHRNYPPADLMPVDARLRVGTVPMRVPSMPE